MGMNTQLKSGIAIASRVPVAKVVPDAPRLCVRSATVGYDQVPVVRDVDLDVHPGLTVLVGPNGCGKSTLLKAIARVLPLQSGSVRLHGTSMSSLPTREIARQLALLPQGPIAPEGLTVRELVAQGRYPHQTLFRQWSEADSHAVDAAIAATRIEAFADRPVDSLSGGQRQRCWIAMVLAQDTPVILLDEPTTFLDLKVQIDLMTLLKQIGAEGRTLLVVLHELNVAAAFADTLVMMRAGRIAAAGRPASVMTPERLHDVFGLDAQVIADPETGRPVCVPRLLGARR
jgi:iron complex transport system ATP-binding protein